MTVACVRPFANGQSEGVGCPNGQSEGVGCPNGRRSGAACGDWVSAEECYVVFRLRPITPSPTRPAPKRAIVVGSGTAICSVPNERVSSPTNLQTKLADTRASKSPQPETLYSTLWAKMRAE